MARLCFLGTPVVAAKALEALCDEGHDIALVVTAPDRRRGRNAGSSPTPVKQVALSRGLLVSEDMNDVLQVNAELGVVVAFGKLIKKPVLDAVSMVNLHFSLLPRWRGAAPVEWAILSGDQKTGVCLMALEEGLDTGPVFGKVELAIEADEHAEELFERLGHIGIELLLEHLKKGTASLGTPVAQDGEASYARKLTVEDRHLDFSSSALQCTRVIRVGRAWTTFRKERLLIHRARALDADGQCEPGAWHDGRIATSDGDLELLEVQREGRARLSIAAWIAGTQPENGERFGEPQEVKRSAIGSSGG